jgi:flagellar biosynthesis protein FlhB
VIAWKKLGPDFSKLNPASGLKSLVSKQRLVSIARALATAVLVGWLGFDLLKTHAGSLANTTGDVGKGLLAAGVLSKKLAWIAGLVGLALAAVDVLVTRRAWLERNKMTKDEVKREYRESEGDPEQKAARKRAHQEMLSAATIAAVREATVLVVNPTHFATALRYDQDGDEAPRVVAQGQGELARRMREAAYHYGVPIVRDVPVARALAELEIGDEIPEALYEAVAEILKAAWEEQSAEHGER